MNRRDDGGQHPPVQVTFLGGLGEIGRNMATIEVDGRLAIVDVGVLFPDAEHLGVDLILPDWGWMLERIDDLDAVFLTHGHLDHIGALPYLLRDVDRAAARLRHAADPGVRRGDPRGVARGRGSRAARCSSRETWSRRALRRRGGPGQPLDPGRRRVRVPHASRHDRPHGGLQARPEPDRRPSRPISPTSPGSATRVSTCCSRTRPVRTSRATSHPNAPSGRNVREHIQEATGLVVVASFASHVHRIQQVLDAAAAVGRRPVFVGRSMVRNMGIAEELDYLDFDPDLVVELERGRPLRPHRTDRRSRPGRRASRSARCR